MCRESEGPPELIGSEADKGGPLQKKDPGGMFSQEKKEGKWGAGVWGVEKVWLSHFEVIFLQCSHPEL